jgi:NADPH-dependent 2,4-dienoyl-CoA reductase/sulfur reductase-like enzyme
MMRYDKLIVATGAKPVQPELPGRELPGVFPLHTMEDSFAVHRRLEERRCESAVLVGGGYIGLEMADALSQRGLDVALLSRTETALPDSRRRNRATGRRRIAPTWRACVYGRQRGLRRKREVYVAAGGHGHRRQSARGGPHDCRSGREAGRSLVAPARKSASATLSP